MSQNKLPCDECPDMATVQVAENGKVHVLCEKHAEKYTPKANFVHNERSGNKKKVN